VGIGFLPPENKTGRGQGFVSYMIKAKPGLPSGTEIRNVADIQFDFSRTIATNQVDPTDPSQGTDPNKEALITLDGVAPTSRVTAAVLPPSQSRRVFTLSWSGEDDAAGAGIRTFKIYVSVDGGPYAQWIETTNTSAVFTGECGRRYSFYSMAADYVGNEQEQPVIPPATIEILTHKGDADGSGRLEMADLIAVLQAQSRIVNAHLDASICADVDGDGRLGMAEAAYILQVLADLRQDTGPD
jgi:hypothetical protein